MPVDKCNLHTSHDSAKWTGIHDWRVMTTYQNFLKYYYYTRTKARFHDRLGKLVTEYQTIPGCIAKVLPVC